MPSSSKTFKAVNGPWRPNSRNDTLADLEEWSQYPPLLELFKTYDIHKLSYLWAHKVLNSRMTLLQARKRRLDPSIDRTRSGFVQPLSGCSSKQRGRTD